METAQPLGGCPHSHNVYPFVQAEPVLFQLIPAVSCHPSMYCCESLTWLCSCWCSREAGGSLCCQGRCSSRCPPGLPGLFPQSCRPADSPQPVSLQGAVPSHVQEFGFVIAVFHKVPVRPFFQLG